MPSTPHPSTGTEAIDLEFLPGLESFVRRELGELGVEQVRTVAEDALRFLFARDRRDLFGLRRAASVSTVLTFDVPRPKALLGDQHLRRLLREIEAVRALHPGDAFRSFRFGAAGSDSSVFQRLAGSVAAATGLRHDPEDGDLLLRVKRGDQDGWEVLVRLTPRPLSARDWRVCNLPGGLNAALAAAMNDVAGLAPGARYLNAMCGSGTLLVEAALEQPGLEPTGFDLDEKALSCARDNLRAAGVLDRVTLLEADARATPFADASFDIVTADLPWGDAVGSHAANAELYPAFLLEAARIAAPGARLVVLTHELKLFARVLAGRATWRVVSEHQVFHGGHRPKLYRLERESR